MIRIGELIGTEVRGPDGGRLGVVVDVRMTCIGPAPRPGAMATPVLTALIVGVREHVRLWGYERHQHIGPWVIRFIVRRLNRGAHSLAWDDVALGYEGPDGHLIVHSRLPKDALPLVRDLPR